MTVSVPPFHRQHSRILEFAEQAAHSWSLGELGPGIESLERFLTELEFHHQQETLSFFEVLRPHPRMNEGGPFCTYFFEFFMNNRPLRIVEMMISKRRKQAHRIEIPADVDVFFRENSLLKIPLEEHLALLALGREILVCLKTPGSKPADWIDEALGLLKDLVTTNHRKEETCLWVAAQNILTLDQRLRLSQLQDPSSPEVPLSAPHGKKSN